MAVTRFRLGSGARGGVRPGGLAPRRLVMGGSAVDVCRELDLMEAFDTALSGHLDTQLRIGSVNLDHLHHFGVRAPEEQRRLGMSRDWVMLVDGMPSVWAARRATGARYPRLAGSDLLPGMLQAAARAGVRVGFLGGTEQTRVRLADVLARELPHLQVVGHWLPPRTVVQDRAASDLLAEEIGAVGVDLLVVGLGKPRQELWIERHGARTGARAVLAFGASADFVAGIVERAPDVMRDSGFEWLYRLSREPRRLARRYLIQGPQALGLMLSGVEDGGPGPLAGVLTSRSRMLLAMEAEEALTEGMERLISEVGQIASEVDRIVEDVPAVQDEIRRGAELLERPSPPEDTPMADA